MENALLDLFSKVLEGDYGDEDAWRAVRELHGLGTREVFDRAAEYCRARDPLKRRRGADIMGQIGVGLNHPANVFPEESYSVLSDMVRCESDERALSSVVYALGHLRNPLAIELIKPCAAHPSADVRYSAAFALGCFSDDADAISTLLTLMTDVDGDVRDWATFGLGVLGAADGDLIRSALVERLSDSENNVREEALVGLAKRQDIHIIPALRKILQEHEIHFRAFEAADYLLGITGKSEGWTAQAYVEALDLRVESKSVGAR